MQHRSNVSTQLGPTGLLRRIGDLTIAGRDCDLSDILTALGEELMWRGYLWQKLSHLGQVRSALIIGPIWGISNYMTFRGLVKYGFDEDAKKLAEKTITLFGRDLERFGALHEYYQPENGEPILNRGFQNWNYLVLNMVAWLEGKPRRPGSAAVVR